MTVLPVYSAGQLADVRMKRHVLDGRSGTAHVVLVIGLREEHATGTQVNRFIKYKLRKRFLQ